jgi:hypothetical protein
MLIKFFNFHISFLFLRFHLLLSINVILTFINVDLYIKEIIKIIDKFILFREKLKNEYHFYCIFNMIFR